MSRYEKKYSHIDILHLLSLVFIPELCAVGVVKVKDGRIVDSFYSLIHPEPEYYQWFCQQVHGLSAEDTENAPVFPYVWEKIEPMLNPALISL